MMIFKGIILFLLSYNLVYGLNIEENRMKKNWERLFAYWANNQIEFWHNGKIEKFVADTKCVGANISEIDKIKHYYNINIPNALLDSLLICNESNRWFGFNGWGLLYGTKEMIDTSMSFENSPKNESGFYKFVGMGITNPATIFPKKWIPIFDWNGKYFVALDMLSSNKGQVIIISVEDSVVLKWANSYEEWFEMVVDEVVKYGELRLETMEKLLGIE
jgi:hypothetical protein